VYAASRRHLINVPTLAACFTLLLAPPAPTHANTPPTLAFLGTHFQNDNAGLEPTTTSEEVRLTRTGAEFTQLLADSGRFKIVPTNEAIEKQIAAGQTVGACGGCEIDYGRTLGADIVAWIRVQKVSNLILNMNVYMADVKSGRMLLTKSVDLRGNTDDSWARSLRYLIKNSVLPADVKPST
jgi:hypothetical protein